MQSLRSGTEPTDDRSLWMAKNQSTPRRVGTSIAQDGRKIRGFHTEWWVLDVAQFFAESPQHPRLGHTHCSRAHLQVAGDIDGRPALDRGQPERLPGAIFELTADLVEHTPEERALGVGLSRGELV